MGSSVGTAARVAMGTIRFAPYVEAKHGEFLDETAKLRASIIPLAPYDTYVQLEVEAAYLGVGYALSDFPPLYDMFGKYMAGFDLEANFESIFHTHEESEELRRFNTEAEVDRKIIETDLPKFTTSMRNINAVASSTFVIGKAQLEVDRLKLLEKQSLQDRLNSLDSLMDKQVSFLNWQKSLISTYAFNMQALFSTKMFGDDVNTQYGMKKSLWAFFVLDFERAALGALQGVRGYEKSLTPRGRSDVSKVLYVASYTVNGAVIGAQIGGPYGAVIGGIIGAVVGIALILIE
jgi:hypothetical protein